MGSEEYAFDQADVAQAAVLLDRLGAAASEPADIASACYGDPEFEALAPALQGELTTLLGYELDDDPSRRASAGLTPQSAQNGWWAVRPLDATPADSLRLWQSLFGAVKDPLVLAQLADLLLTSKADSSAAHASATVANYITVAERPATDSLHASMAIIRAASIARGRRMAEEADVWTSGTELLDRLLRSATAPGGPARVLEMLTQTPVTFTPSSEQRAVVSSLLDLAENLYPDANAADWIADCRRRWAQSDEERQDATQRQIARYLETAEDGEGFLQMHWASRAAAIAKDQGSAEAYEAAVRKMQSIPRDAMGWQSFESTMPVPTVAIRSYVRRVARADSWEQALAGFLASPSPAGSYEHNKKVALEAAKGSIRALFPTTVFGVHGLPERTGSEFDQGEILRMEQLALGTHGILLNEELREIRRRFGALPVEEVATRLAARYGSNRQLAIEYATALDLFWDEKYSDSARILLPLIEAGARGLLLRLDEAIYRLERGNSPGRFPAMDFYIEKLEQLGLDPDWVRALRVALLSPGSNARNLAAHGFRFTFAAAETAVLLRLAGLFCSLPVQLDQVELRGILPQPLRAARRKLRRRLGWIWR
jgi:hypothetical protein